MTPNNNFEAGTSKKSKGVKSFLLFMVGIILLAGVASGVGGYFAHKETTREGPLSEQLVVLLEPGSTVSDIADLLLEKNAIRNADLFRAAVRLRKVQSDLKAGEYTIPAGSSVMEIIDLLVEGKSILHFFTAPEGLTTSQILKLLESHSILEGDIELNPKEGELLPETYALTRGETRDHIIERMLRAQSELVDSLWEDRALELPITTKEQAIILASIVEKETGVDAERARIAAVFINRLKRGMRLESDPTIIYGLTQGEPLGRGLRVSEIRKATPYNTYVIKGLPPTPIANPGKDAIAAVLNPAETDEIFFVADGTGGHVFASTLRQHNKNVAEWRRIERERKQ